MGMQPRHGGGHGITRREPSEATDVSPKLKAILGKVNLANPSAELFDDTAQEISEILRSHRADRKHPNKRTQIRRFYDEMLRFEAELRHADQAMFDRRLPFLRMLNARAAYAAERKAEGGTLVDRNFTAFLKAMLDQVKDRETLRNACTLFEAVIGFSPRDN
jgi:CRISPR-associated protein Csm2